MFRSFSRIVPQVAYQKIYAPTYLIRREMRAGISEGYALALCAIAQQPQAPGE
jgi:hypothetical protein